LRKYTGYVQEVRSRSRNGNNKVVSFCVEIRSANFKYQKNFPSRVEAEFELIKQNIKNKLEIKNIMRDRGEHYKVKLSNGKDFLADKVDLHFIESHIWGSSDCNYVTWYPPIENMAKFSGGILLLDGLSTNTANNKEIRDCLSEINIEYCDWSDLTTPERQLFVATLYTIYMTHAINKKNISSEQVSQNTSEGLLPNISTNKIGIHKSR